MTPKIVALVPAGGHSRRMGRPKLALQLGGRPVLQRVIETLRQGGVSLVLVVVGPHVPELVPLAEAAGASVLLLAQETEDMRATVEEGLRGLEARQDGDSIDSWLLVPADHPVLDAGVVRQLLQTRRERQGPSILIPTFEGRRGHPTLIGWEHVAGIRQLPHGQGLNTYLRQHPNQTLEVAVDSSTILVDLDTPEDYERLQRLLA